MRYDIYTMITELLASLIILFEDAAKTNNAPPPPVVHAARPNGAGFVQLSYGTDRILATTTPNGKYQITLCSALSCRGDSTINLSDTAFVNAARKIGCTVYEDASFVCPTNREAFEGDKA